MANDSARAEEETWSREAVKWQTLAFDPDAARFRLAESRSENLTPVVDDRAKGDKKRAP